MQIEDIRRNVEASWSDTAAFWQDRTAKKYRAAVIDEADSLLKSIQESCGRLTQAREDALRRLKEIQD